MIKGLVNSFQSLGAVDGPGVRFVVFMQGCNLRCGCCHNPDTWEMIGDNYYTPDEILQKVVRYKEYFGEKGGITLSGGEPLLQSQFAAELFKLCHNEGINTCLDTSGSIFNDDVKKLLEVTDTVLLDIKYTNNKQYLENAGCSYDKVIEFLEYLNQNDIPVILRQVIIPGLNDDTDNILRLKALKKKYSVVEKTELLPFKKLCSEKYDSLGIEFPFAKYPEPNRDRIIELEKILGE